MAKNKISVSEFDCNAVLKFLDHCSACAKQGGCRNRNYLKSIINDEKRLVYEIDCGSNDSCELKYGDICGG
jgi:hypothetical protein